MKETASRWDDAVELAYVLNQVMTVERLWQILSKNDAADLTGEMQDKMEAIRMSKRFDRRRFPSDSRHKGVPHMTTPEPYKSLADGVGDYAHAITRNKWEVDKAYSPSHVNELGTRAQEMLLEAIGDLIGRDVYVEGLNPHEAV